MVINREYANMLKKADVINLKELPQNSSGKTGNTQKSRQDSYWASRYLNRLIHEYKSDALPLGLTSTDTHTYI
jgi:hypothetical protein